MKTLFFFTSIYPFDSGETFIENEMPFLSKSFDKIVIISNNINGKQTRKTPQNCTIERLPYELSKAQKVLSLFGVFDKLFWKELKIIKSVYKQNLSKLKIFTALQTLQKAKVFGKHYLWLINKHSSAADNAVLYSYWTNDIAFANSYIKKPKQVKNVISRAHGWDVYFAANQANYLPFRQYILQQSNGIYFISEEGFNYYNNLFPDLKHKMFVSCLGVPKQEFISAPKEDENCFKIVSCSNIISIKRVHLIVEALAHIDSVKIEWLHFGDGFLRKEITELAQKHLKHKANISYKFAGVVSNSDVIAYYQNNQVDAFINVSSSEGIPVSIMEAYSFGIPCVATNVGGTSEIVNNKNGILLSANPLAQDVANAIIEFCALTAKQKKERRENAYKTWDRSFNAERNYTEFLTIINPKL